MLSNNATAQLQLTDGASAPDCLHTPVGAQASVKAELPLAVITATLHLPVIDAGPYLSARREGLDCEDLQKQLVKELLDACRTKGMFYLIGHGIASRLMSQVMAVNARFFASSDSAKAAIASKLSPNMRGYGLLKNYRDWREQIHLGVECDALAANLGADADPTFDAEADYWQLWGPNLWPVTDTADYRKTMLDYFDAMESLSRLLLTLIAGGLGERDDFFTSRMLDRPYLLAKPMSYLPQKAESTQVGVTAHCDWSWLTLLMQDDVGGLEAQDTDGVWHAVDPLADAFVVNTGELLELESGGALRASPHRVINARIDRQRYSVPFFICPALDQKVLPRRLDDKAPYIDSSHVHKVIKPGTVLDDFVFGESEWQRKARGHWCWREECLKAV